MEDQQSDVIKERPKSNIQKLKQPEAPIVVSTNNGMLRGFQRTVGTNIVSIFLGIPYAQPPINKLRFRRPEPVQSWKGIRDATRFSSQCIQFKPNQTFTPWISTTEEISEDCLYLNIWSSAKFPLTELKSVMVWIHGGAFFSGSASLETYDGQTLSNFGDVVVVSFNYRLAAFGFLDLKSEESPGNQGLFDQIMALQWIQDNIKYFGGDPDKVTLFGQSAGAISIGLHYLSPLSKNLFKRGIMQSGSPAVTRLFYERENELADRGPALAKILGCLPSEDAEYIDQAVNCMRMKPSEEIMRAQNSLISEMGLSFAPIVGDDFLPENPIFLMHSHEFGSQKEVMIGVNRDEGTFFLHYLDPNTFSDDDRNVTVNDAMKFVRNLFHFFPSNLASLVFNTFLSLDEKPTSNQIRKTLSNFIADSSFVCPAIIFAQLFEETGKRKSYFYEFDHRPSNSPWPEWMGVLHFDEVPFVFGAPLRYSELYTPEEVELSKRIMQTWTTFAKQG